MSEQRMVYVAADPTQPGAAWAAFVDSPDMKKEIAKEMASWIRKGATVLRVTPDEARAMLMLWVHPDARDKPDQGNLLTAEGL